MDNKAPGKGYVRKSRDLATREFKAVRKPKITGNSSVSQNRYTGNAMKRTEQTASNKRGAFKDAPSAGSRRSGHDNLGRGILRDNNSDSIDIRRSHGISGKQNKVSSGVKRSVKHSSDTVSERSVNSGDRGTIRRKLSGNERKKDTGLVTTKADTAIVKKLEAERIKDEKWEKGVVRTRVNVDRIMLTLILALLCLGTIMVFSAGYPSALAKYGDSLHYIKKQLVFAFIGVAVMISISFVSPNFMEKASIPFYLATLVMLVLVLVVGFNEGEAKRWLGIPNSALSFQPSELMKAALVMALAWFYQRFGDKVRDPFSSKNKIIYGVLLPGSFVGVACILVLLEKHLSGTLIIGVIGFIVMILGGSHIGWSTGIIGAAGGVAGTLFVILNPYALKRITTFMNENADALSDDWQTTQGLYAIGSGGLSGVGLGSSRQKHSYVSEAQNDFIFTIWCEEMGFIGAALLIILFMALVWRGFIIAMHAPNMYSSLVVFGIMSKVAIQVLLNLGVVTDILPNTGVSLPFFSYGGSSLVILMAEMGIVLSVSKHSYQRR